jgi:hypothetical protein
MSRAPSSLCAAVFAVGSADAAPQPVVTGPFEIHLVPARIGAGGFPNTTMNPFRTTTIAAYALVEKIGARFNDALARGQSQDLFEDSSAGR